MFQDADLLDAETEVVKFLLSYFGSLEGALPLLKTLADGIAFGTPGGVSFGSEQGRRHHAGNRVTPPGTLMGEGLRCGAAAYGRQQLGEDSDPSGRFRDRALPASQAASSGEQE
eukprot:8982070-Alexandrium_andersonii.AAC.1